MMMGSITILLCGISALWHYSSAIDVSECANLFQTQGALYKNFYTLKNLPKNNHSYLVDFTFSVITEKDAILLLSDTRNPSTKNNGYEIVLGGYGNTINVIRNFGKHQEEDLLAKVTVDSQSRLSEKEAVAFWLRVNKDFLIEVGREGNNTAFLSYKVISQPLDIKYLGFAGFANTVIWYTGCAETCQKLKQLHFESPNPLSGGNVVVNLFFNRYTHPFMKKVPRS